VWGIYFKYRQKQDLAGDPQILELLQLSHREKELRDRCITELTNYDAWKRQGTVKSFTKGRLLRRRAQKAIFHYKLARRYRRHVFQAYMNALPCINSSGRQ
jgi:hypothetical protein